MAKKTTQDDTLLWERQQGESEQAWEAFLLYLHQEKRNLQAVAVELHKSYTLIRRWKSTWFWEERARAYDNELRRDALKKEKAETRKMYERQAQIGVRFQKVAVEALEKFDLSNATLKDIRELAKIGAELERIGRGGVMTEYRDEEQTEAESKEEVVVYVPDDGLKDGEI